MPILAVLCDGKFFYFFQFVDRRQSKDASPQVYLGRFPDGRDRQAIDDMEPGRDIKEFKRQTRSICESLYYIFLCGYRSGLEAYWKRSVEKGKSQGKGRRSTPGWLNARILAENALEVAKSAWIQQENKTKSKTSAKTAHQFLLERYVSCCFLTYDKLIIG